MAQIYEVDGIWRKDKNIYDGDGGHVSARILVLGEPHLLGC